MKFVSILTKLNHIPMIIKGMNESIENSVVKNINNKVCVRVSNDHTVHCCWNDSFFFNILITFISFVWSSLFCMSQVNPFITRTVGSPF